MCGLAGVFDPRGRSSSGELAALAESMAETLRHRGPDDAGVWVADQGLVAFGHRRLSVIDLSAAGHQPMSSPDGRWMIAYNGELYNTARVRADLGLPDSAYRSHSDTEVLLYAVARWGVERALPRLNGMFAFAVWDAHERELWLARDRFGEKPLYLAWADGRMVFGSELAAVRTVPGVGGEVDREALALLLRRGYVPAPRSIYTGVSKLPAGSVLRVGVDHPTPREIRYWSPVEEALSAGSSPRRGEAAVDELEELLSGVVASRMVADVGLGAFLSGGIDSSTVVALMQRKSTQAVRTFTIGFAESEFDESAHARAVAHHLETDHTELMVSAGDAAAVIPRLSSMHGEPFADASQIPTFLVSELARRDVTVALSGDGGDELFAGYDHYLRYRRIERMLSPVPGLVKRGASRALRAVPPERWDTLGAGALRHAMPRPARHRTGARANWIAQLLSTTRASRYSALTAMNQSAELLMRDHHVLDQDPFTLTPQMQGLGPIERAMLLDTLTFLPDDILAKVDRASMAVSLEVRVPILDPDVFGFAWSLHPEDRVRDGKGKWVLRRLLHRYVPEAMVERPKMGFLMPVSEWLRGPLRSWADDLFDPTALEAQGYLDAHAVRATWLEHAEGRNDAGGKLWPVLMCQAWLVEQ
jgi:asparagine synthase (glutamine-hydrolysing)